MFGMAEVTAIVAHKFSKCHSKLHKGEKEKKINGGENYEKTY